MAIDLATGTTGTLQGGKMGVMVGDSGAGGVKGAVPAPGVGDATKYLKGNGTWDTPSASPLPTFVDGEVVAGAVPGVTYTLAHTPNPAGSLKLYKGNGTGGAVLLKYTADYTLAVATITLTASTVAGDYLLADYRY